MIDAVSNTIVINVKNGPQKVNDRDLLLFYLSVDHQSGVGPTEDNIKSFFSYGGVLTPALIKSTIAQATFHILHPLFKGWNEESVEYFFALIGRDSISSYNELIQSVTWFASVWTNAFGPNEPFSLKGMHELFTRSVDQNGPGGTITTVDRYWNSYLDLLRTKGAGDSVSRYLLQAALLLKQGVFDQRVGYVLTGVFQVDRERLQDTIFKSYEQIAVYLLNTSVVSTGYEQFNNTYLRIKDISMVNGRTYKQYLSQALSATTQTDNVFDTEQGIVPRVAQPIQQERKPEITLRTLPALGGNIDTAHLADTPLMRAIVNNLMPLMEEIDKNNKVSLVNLYYSPQKAVLYMSVQTTIYEWKKYAVYFKDADHILLVEFTDDLNNSERYKPLSSLAVNDSSQQEYEALYEKIKALIRKGPNAF